MAGPTAIIERQLESLSPRDKKLLVGLVLAACFAFLFVIWWVLTGTLDDSASRVREAKTRLVAVRGLQMEFNEASGMLDAAEAKLAVVKTTSVNALVESKADEFGLKDKMKLDRRGPGESIGGDIQTTKYTVEVSKAETVPLYSFLESLELADYPMEITRAEFKKSFEKREPRQNLSLELLVYSKVED